MHSFVLFTSYIWMIVRMLGCWVFKRCFVLLIVLSNIFVQWFCSSMDEVACTFYFKLICIEVPIVSFSGTLGDAFLLVSGGIVFIWDVMGLIQHRNIILRSNVVIMVLHAWWALCGVGVFSVCSFHPILWLSLDISILE